MSERLYTYKFKLEPTEAQQSLMAKHFGCGRFVYNHFLELKSVLYKTKKQSLKRKDMEIDLPVLKQQHPWLKEVGSQSLQFTIECLDKGFQHFFRRCKEKAKKKGYPKFKRRHSNQSFRVKQNISIKDNKLVCPKFLEGIPIVRHREVEGEIRFATISLNRAGDYSVAITVKRNIAELPKTTGQLGIDINTKAMVDSDGKHHLNPLPARQYKAKLKKLAQKVSRATKGSKARMKARQKLAKLKQHIRNIREDYLHKLTTSIIHENQVIVVEDLCVQDMLKKVEATERTEKRWQERKRHRDIADCGYYSFVQKLIYKAEWYGRTLLKVSRWFPSSQLCSVCGWRYKELEPHEREWCCYNCFTNHSRDENAAANILCEGLRIRTCGTQEIAYCPDVRPAKSGLLVG